MNAKTAKLINAHARWGMGNPRIAKRWWLRLPWNKRNKHRLRMQTNLMTAK